MRTRLPSIILCATTSTIPASRPNLTLSPTRPREVTSVTPVTRLTLQIPTSQLLKRGRPHARRHANNPILSTCPKTSSHPPTTPRLNTKKPCAPASAPSSPAQQPRAASQRRTTEPNNQSHPQEPGLGAATESSPCPSASSPNPPCPSPLNNHNNKTVNNRVSKNRRSTRRYAAQAPRPRTPLRSPRATKKASAKPVLPRKKTVAVIPPRPPQRSRRKPAVRLPRPQTR